MKYFLNNVRSLRLYISALFLTSAILVSYGFAQDAPAPTDAPEAPPVAAAEEPAPETPAEPEAAETPVTPEDSAASESPAEPSTEAQPEPAVAEPEPAKTTKTAKPEEVKPAEIHQRESTDVSFRLSKKEKEEIDAMAIEYVDLMTEKIRLEARQEYYTSEIELLNKAADSASAMNLFLADFGSFGRSRRAAAKNIGVMLKDEMHPLAEMMAENSKRMKSRAEQLHAGWKDIHQVRRESEQIRYELETGAKIVAQLASMLSMDKRWFWLAGLIAFSILFAAVLHDKRRELRRWLNGGRARKMRLSKVLFGFIIFLAIATFVTFLFGNVIYRAALDMSVQGKAPKAAFAQQIEQLKKDVDKLQEKADEQTVELRNARKALEKPFNEAVPSDKEQKLGENLYKEISAYRSAVINNAIYVKQTEALLKAFNEDWEAVKVVYEDNQKYSRQAVKYLRLKHFLRAFLGIVLLSLLAWGLFAYFNGVMSQRAKYRNTCPMCLTEGEVQTLRNPDEYAAASRKYQFDPQLVPPPNENGGTAVCTHQMTAKPRRLCNFAYGSQYQNLPKLSIPTLGVPQAGKTFWMTMLYWQLNNGYSSQSKDMVIVPTAATNDLQTSVDELVNKRHLLPATQRDRIPYPMMFQYTDHDPLGRTKVLTSVFDYSGEVTTDVAAEDFRRQRALASDAFLFFIDPTYPWEPQAAALERFNSDLRTQKQIQQWRSLRLPIALCLTKIDLLPTIPNWENAWGKAAKFYAEMEKIDPTGEGLSKSIIEQRSALVDELRKDIWPEWDMDAQIKKLFGGRHMYFPMTAVGLEGSGETDLAVRTLSPFGLAEPLYWVMEMNGFPTL
ncbi:MAG: hypothetical protein IJF84_08985 [Thermoguttaceae bacterium]|nr:hypothetical protein [Thermoguttaceae bacterium]